MRSRVNPVGDSERSAVELELAGLESPEPCGDEQECDTANRQIRKQSDRFMTESRSGKDCFRA